MQMDKQEWSNFNQESDVTLPDETFIHSYNHSACKSSKLTDLPSLLIHASFQFRISAGSFRPHQTTMVEGTGVFDSLFWTKLLLLLLLILFLDNVDVYSTVQKKKSK